MEILAQFLCFHAIIGLRLVSPLSTQVLENQDDLPCTPTQIAQRTHLNTVTFLTQVSIIIIVSTHFTKSPQDNVLQFNSSFKPDFVIVLPYLPQCHCWGERPRKTTWQRTDWEHPLPCLPTWPAWSDRRERSGPADTGPGRPHGPTGRPESTACPGKAAGRTPGWSPSGSVQQQKVINGVFNWHNEHAEKYCLQKEALNRIASALCMS